MAVKIRLTRLGSKKNAHYRVVVIDSHSPRDGKSIETIGRYVPQADPSVVEIDADRARAWLAKGAQPVRARQEAPQDRGGLRSASSSSTSCDCWPPNRRLLSLRRRSMPRGATSRCRSMPRTSGA